MKKYLSSLIPIALAVAIIYVLGNEFAKHWSEIRNFSFHFNLTLLLVSSALYALSLSVFALGWHILFNLVQCKIPFYETLLYFFITQPAKYVPGKIWLPVARMKCCGRREIPHSITFLTTVIEGILEIAAGAYISLYVVFIVDFGGLVLFIGLLVLSIVGILLLIPRVFYFSINLYFRLLKKPRISSEFHASFKQLFLLQIVYLIGMFGIGLSHALFLQSFAPVDARHIPLIIGIGAFSYIASIVAFFTPSGLGVREGIWYLALKTLTTNSVALIFSIASRMWNIIIEALLAFFSLPMLWRKSTTTYRRHPE